MQGISAPQRFIAVFFSMTNYQEKWVNVFLATFTFLEPTANAMIFFAVFLRYVLKGRINKLILPPKAYLVVSAFILVSHLLSFSNADQPFRVISEIIAWSVYLFLVIFIQTFTTDKKIESIIGPLLFNFLMLIAVIGLKISNLDAFMALDQLPIIRIPDTNYLATFLLFLLPLTISLSRISRRVDHQFLSFLVTLVILINLISINARGAVILGIITIIFRVFLNSHKKTSTAITFVLGSVVLSIVFNEFALELVSMLHSQVSSVLDYTHYSNYIRLELWKDILAGLTLDNVLHGVGAGNFVSWYQKYSSIEFAAAHAHNIYLQSLVELGVLGLLSQLALFTIILKRISSSLKIAQKDSMEYELLYSIRLAIILFLAYGFVEATWLDSRFAFLFFIVIGIAGQLERQIKSGSS